MCRVFLGGTSLLLLSLLQAVPASGQGTEPEWEPRLRADERRPEIRSRVQAVRAIERALRRHRLAPDRGPRCRANPELWLFVGVEGKVLNTRVYKTSGSARVDTVAMEAAREIVFKPARKGKEPVPVWIRQPFSFTLRCPEGT